MSVRDPKQKILLRLAAAFCLLLWVGALAACTLDCTGAAKAHDCCHKKTAPENKPACLHAKPVAVLHAPVQIFKPQPAPVYFLATPLDEQISQDAFAAGFFRQTPGQRLISTPEVCLGPAFRSLAPPVLL